MLCAPSNIVCNEIKKKVSNDNLTSSLSATNPNVLQPLCVLEVCQPLLVIKCWNTDIAQPHKTVAYDVDVVDVLEHKLARRICSLALIPMALRWQCVRWD